MKKILPLLLLLLLLILYCVMTKKDSIRVASDAQTHNTVAPALTVSKPTIDYTIIQKDKTYVLSGNFKDTQQQKVLSGIFSDAQSNLSIKGTTSNKTLHGEDPLKLTHAILPHFIANYSNGFKIIDISDPVNLMQVGMTYFSGAGSDIAVAGAYAYVAEHFQRFYIFDISNPQAPDVVSYISIGGYPDRMAL